MHPKNSELVLTNIEENLLQRKNVQQDLQKGIINTDFYPILFNKKINVMRIKLNK